LFRYLLGVNDLANRNFLMANGRVYSIDEDTENKQFKVWTALGGTKDQKNFIHNFISNNYNDLDVNNWHIKDGLDETEARQQEKRLVEIQNRPSCLALFTEDHVYEWDNHPSERQKTKKAAAAPNNKQNSTQKMTTSEKRQTSSSEELPRATEPLLPSVIVKPRQPVPDKNVIDLTSDKNVIDLTSDD